MEVFGFFFQAEDGIRDDLVTGVQTCALPIFDRLERLAGGRLWTGGLLSRRLQSWRSGIGRLREDRRGKAGGKRHSQGNRWESLAHGTKSIVPLRTDKGC